MAQPHALQQRIHDNIAAQNGWISFSAFMHAALYTENLGYYTNPTTVFGADFITAPEISPLFSETLAQAILPTLGKTNNPQILEFGAGSGTMAADMLIFLQETDSLPEAYYIVEVSTHLQKVQQETLETKAPALLSRVQWLQEMPENFTGVVLANEVLDALPAERWTMHDSQPHALGVCSDGEAFRPALGAPITLTLPYTNYPEGYCSETSPAADVFIQELGQKMDSGTVLLIDYGYEDREYFHPDRHTGTLKCFYQHQHHDNPFIHLGQQDISVHANFTALAKAAEAAGFEITDYQTQAQFLLEHGIADLAQRANLDHTETRLKTSQAIQKLTLPGQMGDVVKVMVLNK